MTTIPERIREEAEALLDKIDGCGCDECVEQVASYLSGLVQRGREEGRTESYKRTDEFYARWAARHNASSERE